MTVTLDAERDERSTEDGARLGLRALERRITRSTPDRLHVIGRVLIAGCLLLGLVGVVGGMGRSGAVSDADDRLAEATASSSELYQSLADADAGATTGYVFGGAEPAQLRERFGDDTARAAAAVTRIAALLPDDSDDRDRVAIISERLPEYASLIEAARSYNRQGLAIGQSYLTTASALMRETLLPTAEELRKSRSAALEDALRRAAAIPWSVLAIALALLVAVLDLWIGEYRRTNRIISYSMMIASTCVVVVLTSMSVVTLAANDRLDSAGRVSAATALLDDARAAVLQARSTENLILIASNAGVNEDDFTALLGRVVTDAGSGTTDEPALVDSVRSLDVVSDDRLDRIVGAIREWETAHADMTEQARDGDYVGAVDQLLGSTSDSSGASFARLDGLLAETIATVRAELSSHVGAARGLLAALPWLVGAAALLAAPAIAMGINRKVADYR